MNIFNKLLLVSLGMALIFSFSHAQIRYGSIIGKVVDNEGMALPVVAISISSPSLIEPILDTITNETGFYRFVNLPPGFYTLLAELEGFKKIERKGIRVTIGKTVTVNLGMEQGVIEEVVTVTATPPAVDVKKTEISIVFTDEILRSLPLRSHNLGVIELAPGVYDRATHGSGYTSNQYQVDGQNITDQWHGDIYADVPYDIIKETEVITAGGRAEFGEYTGALISAITKSGGNSLKGEVNFYYFFDKMVNYREDEIAPPSTHYDMNLILGGPIKKDRLWFFGATAYRRNERKSLDIPTGESDLRTHPFFLGKINYLINKNNRGFLSYQYDREIWDAGVDIFTPPSALFFVKDLEHIVNIQHQMIFGPHTFLEAKFSYKIVKEWQIPDDPTLSMHYDLALGMNTGGMGVETWGPTWRARLMIDLSHYKRDWFFGSHDFKLGFTFDRSKSENHYSYVNDRIYYDWNGEPYMYFEQDHEEIVPEGFHEYNAYLQDSWAITDRLTLNLGVRWSYTSARVLDVETPEGFTMRGRGEMFDWSNFAPRLGFSYALTSDLKTVLKASFGRFYEFATWFTFYGYSPYSRTIYFYMYSPTGEPFLVDVFGPAGNQDINSNLTRPYSDTFTIGIKRELFRDFTIEVNYIRKNFRNLVDTVNTTGEYAETTAVDPVTGNTITVYNQTNVLQSFYYQTNPEGIEFSYDGIDVILDKKFSRNWFMQASFHWQRSKGLGNNDPYGTKQGYTYGPYYDPNYRINAYGSTAYNREYQVKLLSSYFFSPLGVRAGIIYSFAQGPRYSRQFQVFLNQGWLNIFAEPRNSLIGDSVHKLDLRFEKTFKLLEGNLGVLFDIHNLFNSDTPISMGNLIDTQKEPLVYSKLDPRYFQLGIRYAF